MTMMIEKWKFLPEAILIDILTWLPVKSVCRFRCVSKNWCNDLSTNPDFIKLHLNHSTEMNRLSLILTKREPTPPFSATFPFLDCNISTTTGDVTLDMSVEYHCPFPYEYSFYILGSCNGLLCLISDHKLFCIWNPVTNDCKKIPQIPDIVPQIPKIYVATGATTFGFGYDCKTGGYKVVYIVTAGSGSDDFSQVRVYTLGTDSWRVIEKIPYAFSVFGRSNGVFLNGVIHWLVGRPIRVILSFDVGEEKFGEMQLPMPLCGATKDENFYKSVIGLLDGKLCLSWYVGDGNVDVWVMKNYGVIDSWTRIFSVSSRLIPNIGYLRPVQTLKNGDVLLFGLPIRKSPEQLGDLILYSPMSGRARFLDTSGYQDLVDVRTHVGSPVSVSSICKAGQEDAEQAIFQ